MPNKHSDKKFNFDTLALHAGFDSREHHNAGTVPIYQSTAFGFNSAEEAAQIFSFKKEGYEYTRGLNPTTAIFEKRLAALHQGSGALALGSGVAAIAAVITTLAQNGENVIASSHLYGGTFIQLKHTIKKHGIRARFFDLDNPREIRKLADKKTRLIFIETLSNPGLAVPDFGAISQIAKKLHIPLVIDNTFATPYLFRPIEHGADIVVESASKYIMGHATGLGGAVVESGDFNWKRGNKFPSITRYNPPFKVNFLERFGKKAFTTLLRQEAIRGYGAHISPFNSFLLIQGLQTLSLRMERHSKNALELARYLEDHPRVQKVNYPGLKSNPYHALARRYFPLGASGALSFTLKGGAKAGKKLIENLRIASHQPNIGDSRTLVIHPASTMHSRLTPAERKKAGIDEGLVRVSAGLEDVGDLVWDFRRAIKKRG